MNHPDLTSGSSQCALILAALVEANGQWVGMLTLHQVSGSMAVHSRISDLRERGHTIEQKSSKTGRVVHSSYRLLAPSTEPTLF